MILEYHEGKPVEDNVALSFVHGRGDSNSLSIFQKYLISIFYFRANQFSLFFKCVFVLADATIPGDRCVSSQNGGTCISRQWWQRDGVLTYGYAGTIASRNYNVFTNNLFVKIQPSMSYYNRQYIITDRLANMHESANSWVDEQKQGALGTHFSLHSLPHPLTHSLARLLTHSLTHFTRSTTSFTHFF